MDWNRLLDWYRKNGRSLPWRKSGPTDPYSVWISEIMSQQSTLKTVIPRFQLWMEKFPTVQNLAQCGDEAEILKCWEGLGYYSRARNIYKTAKILEQNNFQFPKEVDAWESLPGVGPYTARAVCSISFGGRISVPLDGNVLRVGSRFWGIDDPLNSSKDRIEIGQKFDSTLKLLSPKIFSGDAIQALIELGALGCRPGARALEFCGQCPLQKNCWSKKNSDPSLFPRPKLRPPMEVLNGRAWIITDPLRQKLLVRKIPSGEPLGGQIEIPWVLDSGKMAFSGEVLKIGLRERDLKPLHSRQISHSIMNRKFKVRPWGAPMSPRSPQNLPQNLEWRSISDLAKGKTVTTTLTRKILGLINLPKSGQIARNYGTRL